MPIPLIPAITAGAGILQGIFGGIKARKFQKQLENLQSPTYDPNKSILSYYKNALQRYNVNPYESALYKTQQQNIGRNVNQGLRNLQDRRSGLAGISSLVQSQNDALLNAGLAAEQEKNRRFSQLQGATSMKAAEDRQAFNINKMQPFERKYNLLAQRAGAANKLANQGLQNIFSGLNAWQQYDMLDKNGSNSNAGYTPNIRASNRPNTSLLRMGYVPQDEMYPY